MPHFSERLLQRYGIEMHPDKIPALQEYIKRTHLEQSSKRGAVFMENRTNGFLFALRPMRVVLEVEMDIHNQQEPIFIVTDKNFLPTTVLPRKYMYSQMLATRLKREKNGKHTPDMCFDETKTSHTEGLLTNHLRDYYGITLTNQMWLDFQNPDYVSRNVTVLPNKTRNTRQTLGRLLLLGKEVAVVLYDGLIGNVLPANSIDNFSALASKQRVQNRQELMAQKMRGISFV